MLILASLAQPLRRLRFASLREPPAGNDSRFARLAASPQRKYLSESLIDIKSRCGFAKTPFENLHRFPRIACGAYRSSKLDLNLKDLRHEAKLAHARAIAFFESCAHGLSKKVQVPALK